jgi:hypothetical protein
MMQRKRTTNCGSALIIVLWVMVILSSVALTFAYHTRLDVSMAGHQAKRMQAMFLARAGVIRAMAMLRDDKLKDMDLLEEDDLVELDDEDKGFNYDAYAESWRSNEELLKDVEYGPGTFTVEIEDLNSKISLGASWVLQSPEILQRLLEILGNEEEDAQKLAALIIDWQDPDNNTTDAGRGSGFEDQSSEDTYWNPEQGSTEITDSGPAFVLKNAPFDTIEEVLILLDKLEMSHMILWGEDANHNGELDDNERDGNLSPPEDNEDGELLIGLADVCTVEGAGTVNLNTVRRICLDAMLYPSAGDSSEDVAGDIDDYRRGTDDEWGTGDDKFFRDINNNDKDDMDLLNIGALDSQFIGQLRRMGTVASRNFRITSTGKVGTVKYVITTLIMRNFLPEDQIGRDPLDRTKIIEFKELSAREKEQVRFIFERYEG